MCFSLSVRIAIAFSLSYRMVNSQIESYTNSEWIKRTPDFNVIENIWQLFNQQLKSRTTISIIRLEELNTAVKEE